MEGWAWINHIHFHEINPSKRIVWIGKTLGIKGIHVWTLKPQDNKTIEYILEFNLLITVPRDHLS